MLRGVNSHHLKNEVVEVVDYAFLANSPKCVSDAAQ